MGIEHVASRSRCAPLHQLNLIMLWMSPFLFRCWASSPSLRVINHPLEVDDDCRLVAHNPCIMSGGKQGNIAGFAVELRPIVHPNPQDTGNMILKVGSFTTFGFGD